MKTTKADLEQIIKEEIENVLGEGNMKVLEGEIVNGLIEMVQNLKHLGADLQMIKDVIDSGAVQETMDMLAGKNRAYAERRS